MATRPSLLRSAALIGSAMMIIAAGQPRRSTSTPLNAHTSPTWGQILIVGQEIQRHYLYRFVVELYDPTANRFCNTPPRIHMERAQATATVIQIGPDAGKVLVAGGFSDVRGPLATTEFYAPTTNSFIKGPEMKQELNGHTATVLPFGSKAGWVVFAGGAESHIELYDPVFGTFSEGPKLAHIFMGHTATIIPFGPNLDKLLLAGGTQFPQPGEDLATRKLGDPAVVELYSPDDNTISRGPAMNTPRQDHTATVISSGPNAGKILIAGGVDMGIKLGCPGNHLPCIRIQLSTSELYDPIARRFIPGPPMYDAPGQVTAVQLPRGPLTVGSQHKPN